MTTQSIIQHDESTLPFELMDREDERQIVAELRGEVLEEYVYRFPGEDGKEVTGLSKVGIDAACREMARRLEPIRELELTVENVSEEGAFFKCRAGRYALLPSGGEQLLDTTFGVKYQRRITTRRDGKQVPNAFWWEHGAMKAARNARRRLIPEPLIRELIKQFLSEDRGKSLRVPAPNKPAPIEPERNRPAISNLTPAARLQAAVISSKYPGGLKAFLEAEAPDLIAPSGNYAAAKVTEKQADELIILVTELMRLANTGQAGESVPVEAEQLPFE